MEHTMKRGGARPNAGRPRLFAEPVRRSVTMDESHWEAVRLLARATGSTPSLVLAALVEQATGVAAEVVAACRRVGGGEWEETEHGFRRDCREAVLLVNQSTLNERVYLWEVSWHGSYDCISGRASSYREAQERAQEAYDQALARWGVAE